MTPSMLQRLVHPERQSRSARTVEVFGWILLAEAPLVLLAPHWVAGVLQLPALDAQAANYFRLVGLLVGGLGMLYVVSGRLNAQGFVFASMLDRPLVPFIMAALWAFGLIPGALALVFAVSDTVGFLWTLAAWRAERRAPATAAAHDPGSVA